MELNGGEEEELQVMSVQPLYKQPLLKRKRGSSSLAVESSKKTWSECVDQLRGEKCKAHLSVVGVAVVWGHKALQENGCFGSQPVRTKRVYLLEQSVASDTGNAQKKIKLESEENADPSMILNLFPEEAFYLCHHGCLSIHHKNDCSDQSLSLDQLWTHFLSQNDNFVERYTCYYHFREAGWTPKTGLKYGADFLLYKHGPELHHSSYAVQVRGNTRESEEGFNWQDIVVSVRVNEAARKEVMICSVEIPANCRENVLHRPPGIEEMRLFKLNCTVVKRWVPEREQGK